MKQHHSFFRVQERVLPCVQNSIENNSLRSPSDWFFSMTFDFEMAKRTSIAMCKKLKSIKSNNLQTIHSQIFNVYPLCPSSQSYINDFWIEIKCIKSIFKSQRFNQQNKPHILRRFMSLQFKRDDNDIPKYISSKRWFCKIKRIGYYYYFSLLFQSFVENWNVSTAPVLDELEDVWRLWPCL